eukprot:3669855-Pyramimonas_sp.AAC.1
MFPLRGVPVPPGGIACPSMSIPECANLDDKRALGASVEEQRQGGGGPIGPSGQQTPRRPVFQ